MEIGCNLRNLSLQLAQLRIADVLSTVPYRDEFSEMAEAPGYRTWSSNQVSVNEQFEYWGEKSFEVFGPLLTSRNSSGGFGMEIVQTKIGEISLSSLFAQAHCSERDLKMAEHDPTGLVFISTAQLGTVNATSRYRNHALAVGGAGMISVGQPAKVEATSDFHQLVLGIPAELIVPRLSTSQSVGVSLGVLPGLLTQISNFLFFNASALTRGESEFLIKQIAELVIASFGGAGDSDHSRPHLLQEAMDAAMGRLNDPALSVSALADQVKVSKRTLEKLFAERGFTAARWILDRRLEAARRDLASEASKSIPISLVAERWGFLDRTNFSRVFKKQFDCSPAAYRRLSHSD